MNRIAVNAGLDVQVMGVGSLFSVHFSTRPLRNVREVFASDRENASAFYIGLVANGVYIPENHVAFTSSALSDADIEKIIEVAGRVFKEIKRLKT